MPKPRQPLQRQGRPALFLLIAALALICALVLSATAYALLGGQPATGQEVTRAPGVPPVLPTPPKSPAIRAQVRLAVPRELRAGNQVTVAGTVSAPRPSLSSPPLSSPSKQIISLQGLESRRWVRLRHVGLIHGRFHASIALRHVGTLSLRATIIASGGTPERGTSAVAVRHVSEPTLHSVLASYYTDVGLPLACGGTMGFGTLGVANKTLPCGTMVLLVYHGRSMTVPVIDRGPYVGGRSFDLSSALAEALGFDEGKGVDSVQTNVDAGA
jgi:hypothetical protein